LFYDYAVPTALTALGLALGALGVLEVQTSSLPPGISRTVQADNSTVLVARLSLAPGGRETPHTHPFSAIVVQIGAGQVEMTLGGSKVNARRETGHVQFIPKHVLHAAGNDGPSAFDVVTIAIKPDRVPAGSAPPTEPPPGITRQGILDNDEARVTNVRFTAGAREPIHSHPFDLVLVQLTPAKMEVQVGDEKTVKDYDIGAVIFLPRNIPHAVSSAHPSPFEILSVTIK
jgi:quercetin dioxygenase-like cupin family protein